MTAPSPATLELIERVFAALDYEALGAIYCFEEGDAFWEERREPAMIAGAEWAQALSRRLGSGRSLYVGAGVAELPALLTECQDLGRSVQIASLNAPECESLNATLEGLGLSAQVTFRVCDAREPAREGA